MQPTAQLSSCGLCPCPAIWHAYNKLKILAGKKSHREIKTGLNSTLFTSWSYVVRNISRLVGGSDTVATAAHSRAEHDLQATNLVSPKCPPKSPQLHTYSNCRFQTSYLTSVAYLKYSYLDNFLDHT